MVPPLPGLIPPLPAQRAPAWEQGPDAAALLGQVGLRWRATPVYIAEVFGTSIEAFKAHEDLT